METYRKITEMSEKLPSEIITLFKEKFGTKILESRIDEIACGVKKTTRKYIWLKVSKDIFIEAVKYLTTFDSPHFSIISPNDFGDTIEYIYHFTIYYCRRHKEILVNFVVPVAKKSLTLPSICNIIPGALISEREIQDMTGVVVENLQDSRPIFISANFPKNIYPWRKDQEDIIKNIAYKCGDAE